MNASPTTQSNIQPVAVQVTLEPADPSIYRVEACWVAQPVWAGVDRPIIGGISFGPGARGEKLARRYQAAVMAGQVFHGGVVKADVNGATYVAATSRVMGKHANADLKRLGF
jgi:hypothetical protein